MRCLASSIFFASVTAAEEHFFSDGGDTLQLLQMKTNLKHAEGDRRPKTTSTEEESMQRAECALWGDVHVTKSFYGFATKANGDWGWLQVKHKDGSISHIADPMQKGLYRGADSKDGRFKFQVYQTGTPGVVQSVAFYVDGTTVVVRPPPPMSEADAAQWAIDNDRHGWPVFKAMPDDPLTYGNSWLGGLPMNIRVNGQVYSQFDMPMTIPGTNIRLTRTTFVMEHSHDHWKMPGFIMETEGFSAKVEQVASSGDTYMLNINFKLTPDNIPDRDENSFCGLGQKAKPFSVPEDPDNLGPEGDGNWEASLFSKEDHEYLCYFATRVWGGVDGPNFREYADRNKATFGVCTPPPEEPQEKPTAKSLCATNKCDYAIGERACAPLKDHEEDTWLEDCLLEFCMKCEEGASEIFLAEVLDEFPDDGTGDESDEASAEADPHLVTNTEHTFDLKG